MPNHRNPTRRNRNIGTGKQGHGQDNRDRIPESWQYSRTDWSRAKHHRVTNQTVWGRQMPFMVERTLQGYFHACTVDDVASMLNRLPKEHINSHGEIPGIQGVVLRQPTRKENQLGGVWGRLAYSVQVGSGFGPVIFLEAQEFPCVLPWSLKLDPEDQKELDRLLGEASRVEHTKRAHILHFDIEGVRRVQLFRSLAHELGHWVDMVTKVEVPSLDDFDQWEGLWERYFQRPRREREEFAHGYADRVMAELRSSGTVPFERHIDPDGLERSGLYMQDFVPGESGGADPSAPA